MRTDKHPIVTFVVNWGWAVLFICVVSSIYVKASHKRNQRYQFFSSRLESMQMRKSQVSSANDSLTKRVQSQSDPEWIELTLKRVLGMVPEGQTKIHFKTKAP